MDPAIYSLLLKDAATLLRPAPVTVVVSTDSQTSSTFGDHPSVNVLCVLSDLASLFDKVPAKANSQAPGASSTQQRPKHNHVVHKLTFYAAYILGTPAPMLRVLVDEATIRAKMLEVEGSRNNAERKSEGRDVKRVGDGSHSGGPKIEEL